MEAEVRYGFVWIYFAAALVILFLGYRFYFRHYQFIEIPVLPRWRRYGFYISLAVFCLILALTPYYIHFRLNTPWLYSVLIGGGYHLFTANVVIEMQRIVMRSGLTWSRTKHLVVFVLWWLLLFGIDTLGLYLGKQHLHLSEIGQIGALLIPRAPA
jgi:hypothetical protein